MTSRTRKWLPCTLALMFGALTGIPALAETYLVEDAQVFLMPDPFHAGAESEARDININRQIVGWAKTSAGVENAFLYEPTGVYKNVGIPLLTTYAKADGINNHGEVVGYWVDGNFTRGFYWHPSTGFSSLGIQLHPGFAYNHEYHFNAYDINDFGLIVGSAEAAQESSIPFENCYRNIPVYWSRPHSEPRVLYCPNWVNGANAAKSVSNYGWIAGYETTGGNKRGFRFSDGAVTYVPSGDPSSTTTDAFGVNEKGAVVGRSDSRAYYWDGISSGIISLGALPGGNESSAYDVNYQAFVAGSSLRGRMTETGMVISRHAFLWHKTFGMYELPSPAAGRGAPWSRCEANALHNLNLAPNSTGVITLAGYCERSEKKRATRWEVTVRRIG